uniref:Uncharacterized protein n=1 Tax=Tetranychus urticae TaxID=32264 RepID=T1JTK7_TETUR
MLTAISLAVVSPSNVTLTDDNGTLLNLDFSDIDESSSIGSDSEFNQESTIVLYLIDTVKFDSVDEERPRTLANAKYIGSLRRRYSTADLSKYLLTYNGRKVSRDREFNNYQIERLIGQDKEKKILASLNVQKKAPIGRKIIRLALAQSYNRGKQRTIWLTYDAIWKGSPLKHLGQARTLEGWAMMWTDPQ